jgi:hypothetical protein
MYKIVKDGELLSICDAPRYIKYNERTASYVLTTEEEAEGVAVDSTPYELFGKTLEGNQGVVLVNEVDGGELVFADQNGIKANSDAIDEILISMLGE